MKVTKSSPLPRYEFRSFGEHTKELEKKMPINRLNEIRSATVLRKLLAPAEEEAAAGKTRSMREFFTEFLCSHKTCTNLMCGDPVKREPKGAQL